MPSSREPPDRRICDAETLDGEPCHSWALPGSLLCFAHDPDAREARDQARFRGGKRSGKVRALRGKRHRLDTMPALVRFTATVIQDVLAESNALDVNVARTVLYGLSIQRQLVESADLDQRLKRVEERLGLRQKRRAS